MTETKKDETGLPTKLKMKVPRDNVFGIIFAVQVTRCKKNLDNKTKTLVRNAKKKYYKKIFEKQNDSNGKNFYRYLNQICHSITKRKEISSTIDSETFNNFFVNIGPSPAKKIEKPYNGKMINRVVHSFVLRPVQKDEVKCEATC